MRIAGTNASWLLIVSLCLTACGRSQAVPPGDIAETAREFIAMFASDRLSATAATALIRKGGAAERNGAYWQVRSEKGSEEIVLRAETLEQSTDDAELRLRVESGLTLSDLEKAFGPWKLVFSSETSSVNFRVVAQPDKPSLVFVRLLTPKPLPDSPVLSVQLRRDRGTPDQQSR